MFNCPSAREAKANQPTTHVAGVGQELLLQELHGSYQLYGMHHSRDQGRVVDRVGHEVALSALEIQERALHVGCRLLTI